MYKRERGGGEGYHGWHHVETDIFRGRQGLLGFASYPQIYTYLLNPCRDIYFRTFLRGFRPGGPPAGAQDDASSLFGRPLLSRLTTWLCGLKTFTLYIFWIPSHFPFLLTSRDSQVHILFRNLQLTCGQRSIDTKYNSLFCFLNEY